MSIHGSITEDFLFTFCHRVTTNQIILWKISEIIVDRRALYRINTLFPLKNIHLPTVVCGQDAYLETAINSGRLPDFFDVYITEERLPSCYNLLEPGSNLEFSVFLSSFRDENKSWKKLIS